MDVRDFFVVKSEILNFEEGNCFIFVLEDLVLYLVIFLVMS